MTLILLIQKHIYSLAVEFCHFSLSHTLDQRAGIEALKIKMHCQVCLKTSHPFYVSRGLGLIYIHAI